jgi:hypothetical protein
LVKNNNLVTWCLNLKNFCWWNPSKLGEMHMIFDHFSQKALCLMVESLFKWWSLSQLTIFDAETKLTKSPLKLPWRNLWPSLRPRNPGCCGSTRCGRVWYPGSAWRLASRCCFGGYQA